MRGTLKSILYVVCFVSLFNQFVVTSVSASFAAADMFEEDFDDLYPDEYRDTYADEYEDQEYLAQQATEYARLAEEREQAAELQRQLAEDAAITQELLQQQEARLAQQAIERERIRVQEAKHRAERLRLQQQEEAERAQLEEERQQELQRQRAIAEAEYQRIKEEESRKKAEQARIEAERQRIAAELQRQAEEDEQKARELRERKEAEQARLEAERQREEELHRSIAEAERKARELQRLRKIEEEKLKKEQQKEEARQRKIEHAERKAETLHKREAAKKERLEEQREKAARAHAARKAAEQEKLRIKEKKRAAQKQLEREKKSRKLLAIQQHKAASKPRHSKTYQHARSAVPSLAIAHTTEQDSSHEASIAEQMRTLSGEWLEQHLTRPITAENMTTFNKNVRIRYHLINASKDQDVIAARRLAHQARDSHQRALVSLDDDTEICLRNICSIAAYFAAQKHQHSAASAAAMHGAQEELYQKHNALSAGKISFNQYYQDGLAAGKKAADKFMTEMQEPQFKRFVHQKAQVIATAHEVASAAVQHYLATAGALITPTDRVLQQETSKNIYAAAFSVIADPDNQHVLLTGNQDAVEQLIAKASAAGSQQTLNPIESENAALQSFSAILKRLATPTSPSAGYEPFARGSALVAAQQKLFKKTPHNNTIVFTSKMFDAALHDSNKDLSKSMQVSLSGNIPTESAAETTKRLTTNLMARRAMLEPQ